MIGWFVHGWGFGPSIWDELVALLPDLEPRIADRGYFGGAPVAAPDEPAVWITHSLGAMQALSEGIGEPRALVAINGFDRFTASEGFAGVPRRVLDRMIARFDDDPGKVLSEFRTRCGNDDPVDHFEPQPLRRDLVTLRDGDTRAAAAAIGVPVLVLDGARDPLLPEEMRRQVFAGARDVKVEPHPEAGHLLPLEDPEWCAEHISSLCASIAP